MFAGFATVALIVPTLAVLLTDNVIDLDEAWPLYSLGVLLPSSDGPSASIFSPEDATPATADSGGDSTVKASGRTTHGVEWPSLPRRPAPRPRTRFGGT